MGAWPAPLAPCGGCGNVAGPLGLLGSPWGHGRSPGPVWLPWGRGRTSGSMCLVWGRARSPGLRVAAVGPWLVPWAPCNRRGGVAGPLGPVSPPRQDGLCPGPRAAAVGLGRSPGSVWLAWGRGWSPGLRVDAVGAWPVP